MLDAAESNQQNRLTPIVKTDYDRLVGAFAELRACGWWARTAQQRGWKAVPEDVIKRCGKWVVWDEREGAAIGPDGMLRKELHMHHFWRDSAELAGILRQHGIDASITKGSGGEEEVVVHPLQIPWKAPAI